MWTNTFGCLSSREIIAHLPVASTYLTVPVGRAAPPDHAQALNLCSTADDYPDKARRRGKGVGRGESERVYDELLVVLIQGGDARAAERLAARWHPRLLRTARRLLRDREAAREAVQETWVSLSLGWGRLSDPARFPAWAFGVLHRRCVDQIRREGRRRRQARTEPAPIPASAAAAEDRLAVAEALEGLGLEHRTAAVLYFLEGLTVPEIAEATGVPAGTVKSRLFHARRRLQAALQGEPNGQP